ncbi:TetM/TetW/TetO/TetS family tetracycline resistance ribosomal protection protein [Bifidobacterium callimiconis]|uniref:GTP-binding protein n=1 Tax=Bifidobacterium callimiconis TaxID=2306973 RepID=UPI001BDC6F88|nr:TetM/TetW/TetO/TetS family tetracycline resistance ribosomal protection protein [Bifidobacterium callimiconis]MBT1176079.1 TetM/TetW/TetO/TetS family tetracycline resistance ribosomal protection protein [Bifidobacterium callimiconis]
MKQVVVGILAHVDAGKTTLSEGLLYRSGQIRSFGRVDHGDAFLDTDAMEKQRGITIFSKQAVIDLDDLRITLLDTPGHVDFSAEMERTLRVLDYAILVVSASDGVRGYTETLWRLLARYHVPTFVFVNKMDAVGADGAGILAQMRARFSDACVPFAGLGGGFGDDGSGDDGDTPDDGFPQLSDDVQETMAMQDESAMDEFLEQGALSEDTVRRLIAERRIFPCYFGSALKLQGVDDFLHGLRALVRQPDHGDAFGARVFKISHDKQGGRLTWLKVTGGVLPVKSVLTNERPGGADGSSATDGGTFGNGGAEIWHEKADQVRVYSGAKFTLVDEAPAGSVVAVTGPTHTFPGEGLGMEFDAGEPALEPVLTYTVLPGDNDVHKVLAALRELDDEDPLLHVAWQERLQEIHVQLMGAVQLEIIRQIMHDRFSLDIDFGPGGILYKETITAPVEGVGHFEPLRHYAEVHLLLEPADEGSGVSFGSNLSLDVLDRNWQRLVLTHLAEKEHLGVLAGFPITDMRITLINGRAHEKHTEGGDFRQATYRAIRQGLMKAKRDGNCRLLEPWYDFRLEVPQDMLGRAMSDVQRMSGEFDPPTNDGEYAVLSGTAPVSEMRDYAMDVNAYTHGQGQISCTFGGYRLCHDAEAVIERVNYDPESDLENTPDSVFCAHGAGYPVKWSDVDAHAHLELRAL